jgi:hypothetical protein
MPHREPPDHTSARPTAGVASADSSLRSARRPKRQPAPEFSSGDKAAARRTRRGWPLLSGRGREIGGARWRRRGWICVQGVTRGTRSVGPSGDASSRPRRARAGDCWLQAQRDQLCAGCTDLGEERFRRQVPAIAVGTGACRDARGEFSFHDTNNRASSVTIPPAQMPAGTQMRVSPGLGREGELNPRQ